MYYVYEHIRADTKEPFYIGKGKGKRAYTTYDRNKYWWNIANKHGREVNILEYFNEEAEAYRREREIEVEYRAKGYKLCNIIDCGNPNPPNYKGKKQSTETKIKIGKANRERVRTEWEINQVRVAQKKRYQDPEQKEYLRQLGLKAYNKTRKPVIQKDMQNNFIKEWESASEAARQLNYKSTNISKCCRGKSEKYYNFKWEFKNV